MAKKKRSGRKAPTRRRSAKPARRSRRRGGVQMAGFTGAATQVLAGVAGAVLASKVAAHIPVSDPKTKNLILAAGGLLMIAKGQGMVRNVGIGVGIAGATLVVNDYFPNLLGGAAPTVGRLTPEMDRRIQRAADQIRQSVGGLRGRTILGDGGVMGSGGAMDFPQSVGGSRGRTIMGSGDSSVIY